VNRNKTILRATILLLFVLVNAGILYGISQIIAYLNTGADKSTMLHLDAKRGDYYLPDVTWESVDNPGRPLEPANQTRLEQDYLDAWYVRNNALFTGDETGINDHYTSSARVKLKELMAFNQANGISIETTTLAHHPTLEFYSADGKLAVLTDRKVRGFEKIYTNDTLLQAQAFNADYRVVLLLEDGFWRIRHFERLAARKDSVVTASIQMEMEALEGINYYPQETPWDTFGENFDRELLAKDFRLVTDLNLNCIRVFIGYEDFGKANPKPEKLEKLTQLLDEADKAGLKVMVTLFDFYGNYSLSDYTLTNKHLSGIVNHVKEHPALWGWDVKNEPDLDFESRGKETVLFWLRQSIQKLRALDGKHPISIGWSTPEAAVLLENEVDVVSYHYYRDLSRLSEAHQKLKNQTQKPVVLQEIGYSSYSGIWNGFGIGKTSQDEFYEEFLQQKRRDSINYLSWTLFDFREVPERVVGRFPWRKNKQKYFGIIDQNGVKDEAYYTIKNR